MSVIGADFNMVPGMGTVRETSETAVSWNKGGSTIFSFGDRILSSTTDSGGSPTTTLRAGLLLGKITSSGKLTVWSATATDGSDVVYGVLPWPVRMLDTDATAVDRHMAVMIGGYLKAASIVNLTALARQQMRGRFIFDDDIQNANVYMHWVRETAKTADYTITAADNGTLFTNTGASGAVVFTLPTKAAGLVYHFKVIADQTVTVASAGSADDLVTFNDAGSDSVAFSTSGEKIGASIRVYCNAAASKWYVDKLCSHTMTVA